MQPDDFFSLNPENSNFVTKELMEEFSDVVMLHDTVLMLPLDGEEDKTLGSGMIVMSKPASKKYSCKAVVIAVGPGKLLEDGTRADMHLKVGDIVYHRDGAPVQITRKGKATLVSAEEFIMMKDLKTIEDYQ